MTRPVVSQKKAKSICIALFLVFLAILSYTEKWWPGILLVVGLPLALKQYFAAKKYDVLITLFVFCGGFITEHNEFSAPILLPVLFTIGAIYVFCRDWIETSCLTEEEQEEDLNEEIEEEQHKQ